MIPPVFIRYLNCPQFANLGNKNAAYLKRKAAMNAIIAFW
mgnify:FL=1